jgi:hypothetical protein
MLLSNNQFQATLKLGIILIQKNVISQKQLQIALAEQKRNGKKLGTILLQNQWLTPAQLEQTLEQQKWYRRLFSFFRETLENPLQNFPNQLTNQSLSHSIKIGEVLVNKGYINSLELEKALQKQQDTGQKLGQILIEQGVLSQKELKVALNEQKWLNFVASFLFVNMSSLSLSVDSVQADSENSAQANIRFQAHVPETVQVEVNPQVFASRTPLSASSSLISVKDNANSKESIAQVKYDEEDDRYTIIPR